jgi:hypothetical protein
MPVTVVDLLLGSAVLGLAGWALVQSSSPRPAGGGCGGGCASRSCGEAEEPLHDEPLVRLGTPPETSRER